MVAVLCVPSCPFLPSSPPHTTLIGLFLPSDHGIIMDPWSPLQILHNLGIPLILVGLDSWFSVTLTAPAIILGDLGPMWTHTQLSKSLASQLLGLPPPVILSSSPPQPSIEMVSMSVGPSFISVQPLPV
jgi:hypothetical protein